MHERHQDDLLRAAFPAPDSQDIEHQWAALAGLSRRARAPRMVRRALAAALLLGLGFGAGWISAPGGLITEDSSTVVFENGRQLSVGAPELVGGHAVRKERT